MYGTTVLSIAGSDSGGGAGIQADLAAFTRFKVYGTTALTAVTAQNPHGVNGVYPVEVNGVAAQIDAVFAAFQVGGVKTGMLFSGETVRVVAEHVRRQAVPHVVVDPVMVATSGARLLRDDAVAALRSDLLPCSTLITPNLPEAEILLERTLGAECEQPVAARDLACRYGAWALVKGGHGRGEQATDYLSDGRTVWVLSCPREAAATTHGTGCSLSAAAVACLALGLDTVQAVLHAKAYVLGRLRQCVALGPETWGMVPPSALPVADIHMEQHVC